LVSLQEYLFLFWGMTMPATNDEYLYEINQCKAVGQLTDGMLDIMEEFVNAEADRRISRGLPYIQEHRQALVDDTIAMFEAGLLELHVLDFESRHMTAKEWFAAKATCAFNNVTNKRIWGR